MNKLVNPFLILLLRSRLHGLASAGLLLITYRGLKSGKEYSLPVQFAQDGNTIYIMPAMPEHKVWWRNLRGGAPVKVMLRGRMMTGIGQIVGSPDGIDTIQTGLALYLKRFPGLARMLHVQVEADGSFNTEDVKHAAERVVLVRIDLDTE